MSKTERIISNNLKTLVVFGIYGLLIWFALEVLEKVIFWSLPKSFLFFITVGLICIIVTALILSMVCGGISGYVGGNLIGNRILTKGFYTITIVIISIIKLTIFIRTLPFNNSQAFITLALYLISCFIFLLPVMPKKKTEI